MQAHHGLPYLREILIFLAAAGLVLPVALRLRVNPVLGYLAVGGAIGPFGLGLWAADMPLLSHLVISDLEGVRTLAELGIIFLLFTIGLELSLDRLWAMRRLVFGLGGLQVCVTAAAIAAIALAFGNPVPAATVFGAALALSSTAIAIQILVQSRRLATPLGRTSFSILLLQDLAVVPILLLVGMLAAAPGAGVFTEIATALAKAALAIGAIYALGRLVLRPVLHGVAQARSREMFMAAVLLVALGTALLTAAAGLSMALGAFLAGVLLAESEYRHEIEAAVEPFKGLLLGLFFISVGMSVDFGMLLVRPLVVLGIIAGLFALKGAVLWVIARAARLPATERPLFILVLAQGGEFAFVLLGLGEGFGAMPAQTAHAITLAVALSMLATPFLLLIHDRLLMPRVGAPDAARAQDRPESGAVIIAGLGRMGQVVARLLHASGVSPVVLDDDPDHVEQCRKFGFRVFYGDATRLDLLHAAGADSAAYIIIALDDRDATSQLARACRKHFPRLRIIARARDMRHLFDLRDIGVEAIERETFQSSLKLGEMALTLIGGDAARARRIVGAFEAHDREVLAKLYAVHRDAPDRHITVSNELRDELATTLREDRAQAPPA